MRSLKTGREQEPYGPSTRLAENSSRNGWAREISHLYCLFFFSLCCLFFLVAVTSLAHLVRCSVQISMMAEQAEIFPHFWGFAKTHPPSQPLLPLSGGLRHLTLQKHQLLVAGEKPNVYLYLLRVVYPCQAIHIHTHIRYTRGHIRDHPTNQPTRPTVLGSLSQPRKTRRWLYVGKLHADPVMGLYINNKMYTFCFAFLLFYFMFFCARHFDVMCF